MCIWWSNTISAEISLEGVRYPVQSNLPSNDGQLSGALGDVALKIAAGSVLPR